MSSLADIAPIGGPELYFSRAEYAGRLQRVLAGMVAQDLDVLIISSPSNIAYLSGLDVAMPSACMRLVVSAHGHVRIHCAEVEAPTVLQSSIVPSAMIECFDWTRGGSGSDLARVVELCAPGAQRVGVELGTAETFGAGSFDARSYLELSASLAGAHIIDATNLVLKVRLIKSSTEISYMRQAGRSTSAGLHAGIAAITEGATETSLAAAVYEALATAGSQSLSIDPMIVSGSRTGWGTHLAYSNRAIERGTPVFLEISGTHHRYNAPAMRTGVLGRPSDGVSELAAACMETVEALIGALKPGRTGDEIAADVKGPLDSVDGAWFHGGYGYSVRLGVQPTWTEAPVYIAEGSQRVLQTGMTFHLAICSMVPGSYGVGFSETVAITDVGCESLTPHTGFELAVRR